MQRASSPDPKIVCAGHPSLPTGRGEDVRCTFRSLQAARVPARILDMYRAIEPDSDLSHELSDKHTSELGDINIFHINGDEVPRAAESFKLSSRSGQYNIIYPAWELQIYPNEWAQHLDQFDEIWAPSKFIYEALINAASRPVLWMPLSCEVRFRSFFGRRYFDLPEAAYIFLFTFDLTSYVQRKNPYAVLTAFREILNRRPREDIHLVLKVSGGERQPKQLAALRAATEKYQNEITIIDRRLTDNEIHNLMRNTDCFISLHRSEGYGRGLAEAMYLGLPTIATGFSGNMDFMTEETAQLVRYRLVPLGPEDYPHAQDQLWAEADVDHAVQLMLQLVDDPAKGRALGARASRHIRQNFGYRAAGLRCRDRIAEILSGPPTRSSPASSMAPAPSM